MYLDLCFHMNFTYSRDNLWSCRPFSQRMEKEIDSHCKCNSPWFIDIINSAANCNEKQLKFKMWNYTQQVWCDMEMYTKA